MAKPLSYQRLPPLGEHLLGGPERGAEVYGLAQLVEHLLEGGQRAGDIEVADIAHMTDAEDLALRRATAAVDGDVVRGREPFHDSVGIHTRRHLHRGERGTRGGLREEGESKRLGAGTRGAREAVVATDDVRQPLFGDHAK